MSNKTCFFGRHFLFSRKFAASNIDSVLLNSLISIRQAWSSFIEDIPNFVRYTYFSSSDQLSCIWGSIRGTSYFSPTIPLLLFVFVVSFYFSPFYRKLLYSRHETFIWLRCQPFKWRLLCLRFGFPLTECGHKNGTVETVNGTHARVSPIIRLISPRKLDKSFFIDDGFRVEEWPSCVPRDKGEKKGFSEESKHVSRVRRGSRGNWPMFSIDSGEDGHKFRVDHERWMPRFVTASFVWHFSKAMQHSYDLFSNFTSNK